MRIRARAAAEGCARKSRPECRVVFFSREIGPSLKGPAALSIYLSKKRAPCLSAYLSISPKNERLTFFCFPPPPPSHAFVGFLKDEKWHAGPDFTPVSGKNSREMALRWPRLGFSSHFLQPIYLSLQKTSASPLGLSIYLSKYRAPLKFQLYLRKKKRNPGKKELGRRISHIILSSEKGERRGRGSCKRPAPALLSIVGLYSGAKRFL